MLKAKANGYTALKEHRGRTKPSEEMTEVKQLRLENRQLKTQIKEQEVYALFLKKVQEIQNKE